MSYLEKLLVGVAVEWKPIWDVTTWDKKFNAVENYKQPKTKKYHHLLAHEIKELILEKGNVKLLTTNETDYWTSEELAGTKMSNAEIIAIPWGGNVIIQYYKGKFLTGDNRIAISNDINYLDTKYLFYYLKNNLTLLSSFYRGSGIKHPSMANVLEIQIPIPPIEIQQKIVSILDSFTELTAELTARKTQYSYYREKLLICDESKVEWKTLREVGEIKRGVAFTKKQAVFGKFPVVANAAEPISFHNEFNRNGEFIVVARSGANAGLISYWNQELFLTDAFSIHPNDSILNTKFAFYFLKKHQREIHLMKEGSGVPHVRASDFEIYKIPILPLEEQERIVSILDKFDILTTSISEGLPKEIELRKKQYEYYRDLLLTFKQPDV